MPKRSSIEPRPPSPEVRRPDSESPSTDSHGDARYMITLDGRFPAEPWAITDPHALPKELVGAYLMG